MRFSRNINLKTSFRGRNPLQQFYNALNDETLISPIEFINQTRIVALDQRANTYKVRYSVGGFSENNQPVPLTRAEIIDWVRSSAPDDFPPFPTPFGRYQVTRPDGSIMNLPSRLENFRQGWLEGLLQNPDFLIQLGFYVVDSDEWESFFNALAALPPTDLLVEAVTYIVEYGLDLLQIRDMGTLVSSILAYIPTLDFSDEFKRYARITLAQLTYGILPSQAKIDFTLAALPGSREYQWNNTIFSVPYVLRRQTSNYYESLGSDGGSFHLNPEYHYYLDCYEERISGSAIHENLLPNIYIQGLTLNGVPAPPRAGQPQSRISSDWDAPLGEGILLQYAYDYHTTLNFRTLLPDVQMSQDSMSQYLQQVGNILSSGEIPDDEQRKIRYLVDSIIFPESEYGMYNSISYNDFAFPMKIDVKIPFDETKAAGDILREGNVDNIVSRAIQALEYSARRAAGLDDIVEARELLRRLSLVRSVQDFDFQSEYLVNFSFPLPADPGAPAGLERPREFFVNQPQLYYNPSVGLNSYNLTSLLAQTVNYNLGAYGSISNPRESLLFSALGGENASSTLSLQERQNISQALLRLTTLGENVVEGTDPVFNRGKTTYSEALIYKLEKRNNDGDLIQSLYFENQKDVEQVIYTDTQIKYNKNYDYQIIEYRLLIGVEETFTLCNTQIPAWLDLLPLEGTSISVDAGPLGDIQIENVNDQLGNIERDAALQSQAETPTPFVYEFIVTRQPTMKIIEHRIVGPNLFGDIMAGGTAFPKVKVMDRPPVAPDLLILPIKDNYQQVKTMVDPGSGQYLQASALPIVSIGDNQEKFRELDAYQAEFEYYKLPIGKLEFADEGVAEIKQFTLYWTTSINENISSYNQVYRSFDPASNEDARMKKFRTDELIDLEGDYAPGFSAVLDLEPNVTYYMTCTVEDVHENVSNPSPIYEVRLHYEKGLLVPQIKLFHFVPLQNKQVSRKMARFIEIKASAIQTQPAIITNDLGEVVGTRRALAANIGDRVTNNDFVIRFTSRDTGKKFDLRVAFAQRDITPEEDRSRCGPLVATREPINVDRGVINAIQDRLAAVRRLQRTL